MKYLNTTNNTFFKLYEYARLMRLDKPIGTLLLLWPTLWGLWAASDGAPRFSLVCIFVLGVWIMRCAGCVINDYADRDFDGHVERTKQRPLAKKSVSEKEALLLFVGLLLFASMLLFFLNTKTQFMAIVAAGLATLYPFMKRYTHWPQLILGFAFSWSILMAYTQQNAALDLSAWSLFFAGVCWTLVYDTLYAAVDREDDLKIGIKSTAILFGNHVVMIISLLQIATLGFLILFGLLKHYNLMFFIMLCFAFLISIYQYGLMKKNYYFKAFLNNNWYGALVFVGIFLS